MIARAAALATAFALLACSGPQPPAAVQARGAAERRVHRADIRADESAWAVPGVYTEVRRNPVACDCPEWEARLSGSWTRVELRVLPSADPETATTLAEQPPGVALLVPVTLGADVVEAANGWRYRVLEVVDGDQVLGGRSIE